MTAQILGWIATILFTICYLPQIARMLRTRSVKDISPAFLFIVLVANIVALFYSLLIQQPPLIIKYVAGIAVSVTCIYFYFRIRNEQ